MNPSNPNLTFSHLRFCAQESTDRLNVCRAISEIAKDLGSVENHLAKNLSKIGRLNLDEKHIETVAVTGIVSRWEAAIKITTSVAAKEHTYVSNTVTSHVSKSLADLARLNSKRVQDIVSKVKYQYEEIARARQAFHKQLEKYRKTVQETELSIRQRDSAILEEKKNSAAQALKEKNDASSTKEGDSFVNRSLNKMMIKMKMTPSDVTRRCTEKCRELLRELDASEAQLLAGCQRINSMRDELLSSVEVFVKDLQNLESARLSSMSESLKALCLTQNAMVEHFKTAVQNTLLTTTHENANFDPHAEAIAIIHAVEDPPSDRITPLPGWSQTPSSPLSINNSPDTAKAQSLHKQISGAVGTFTHGDDGENTYLNTNRHAGWKKETTVQFHQIQRMMEAIDALKILVNWVGHAMKDTVSYNRIYARRIRNVCEKHGFPNTSSTSFASHEPDQDDDECIDSEISTFPCAELMAGVESPTIKAAWQFAVQAFEDSAVVHHRTAASYVELLPSLTAVDKNLRALKKELHEHQTNGMKEIDIAQSWIQKLSQKITKLRHELGEQKRKLAMAPPKEGMAVPLSTTMSLPKGAESDDSEDISEVEDNKPLSKDISNPTNAVAGGGTIGNTTVDTTRLEKIKRSMKDKLRFESIDEKRDRRTLRVMRLETEENNLMEDMTKANTSLEHVLTTITTELRQRLDTAKEVFSKDMGNLMLTLKRFHTLQQQFVQDLVNPFQQFEEICQGIDLTSDMMSYVSAVFTTAGACKLNSTQDSTGNAVVWLELPETMQFVCTKSIIIEEERKALKSGTVSPVSGVPATTMEQGSISGTNSGIFSHPLSGSSSSASSNLLHVGSSSSIGGMSSGGLSTIGLGREGREKAHSAVKKLFSSSASSFSSPVMKPDSLMKKLTNRGGTASPIVPHVPQVTPTPEGSSLFLSPSGGNGGNEMGMSQLRQGGD